MKSYIQSLLIAIFAIGFTACSSDNEFEEIQDPNKVKVTFVYTLDTSNSGTMSRATTNENVFNEFYEKIKTGELVAPSYSLTLTEVNTGVVYTFNGNWNSHDLITLNTGTYSVVGTSTADGANIQDKCSFTFNEQIEISATSNVITLHANYDCFLLIFNNSQIESLENNNGNTQSSFYTFENYRYAFVNEKLFIEEQKDNAYIWGKYTDNAEFKIFTGNLNFEKGKYYVYNSVSNGFDVPPMENGSVNKFIEVCGIKWATGNLQYDKNFNGENNFQQNWRIAPYQWHYFNYDNKATEYSIDTCANNIDHFTWGVCGVSNFLGQTNIYATATNIDISSKLYLNSICTNQSTDFLTAKYGDLAYWASNGEYRLPTKEEIATLINVASYQFGYYIIEENKVYGYLFTTPMSNRITNTNARQITKDELANGLFLPLCGYAGSKENVISGISEKCAYWSSYSNENYPQTLLFEDKKIKWGMYLNYYGQWRSDLLAIRPIYNE